MATATESKTPVCEARDLSVTLGAKSILEHVSLAIHEGKVVAILGPSGCGKSTLLRAMIGLLPAPQGQVLAHGRPLQGIHPGVALVFQNFALFPWLTVRQNVELALSGSSQSPADIRAQVTHSLNLVGLDGHDETFPKELSGGMKQRVGIARALACQPEVLCLDEPFSALDVFTAENLRSEIYHLWQDWRMQPADSARPARLKSILLITHLIEEAVFLADRIVVMAAGPGRIREIVDNPLPHPRTPTAPGFARMVQQIHQLVVAAHRPAEISTLPEGTATGGSLEVRSLEPIPSVELGEVLGLMKILRDRPDPVNVFELDQRTRHDFGRTMSVVIAGDLLDLLDSERETVVLTETGRRLVRAEGRERKRILREQMLKLRLFERLRALLAASPDNELARGDVEQDLRKWLHRKDVRGLFQTLVAWGRACGLWSYHGVTQRLALAHPPTGKSGDVSETR